MFESFQKFLVPAANRYGIQNEMRAATICQNFRDVLPEIIPKADKTTVSPAHYKESTLVVNVSSHAWAQEVVMKKSKIIREMNSKMGKEVIKNLRTQLKTG